MLYYIFRMDQGVSRTFATGLANAGESAEALLRRAIEASRIAVSGQYFVSIPVSGLAQVRSFHVEFGGVTITPDS